MNERLKQIMIESGTHKYISAECQHRIEIVAELIVQECIGIADEYDGVGSTIVSRIKKHFGVDK
jgi:hypothetical protein